MKVVRGKYYILLNVECCQGFKESITLSRTHGLAQLWLGWGVNVVRGLRKPLYHHNSWFGSIMAWIVVALTRGKCHQGFEKRITSYSTLGFGQLWLGYAWELSSNQHSYCSPLPVMVWIRGWKSWLGNLLHPPELMIRINCGLDSCGLDQG